MQIRRNVSSGDGCSGGEQSQRTGGRVTLRVVHEEKRRVGCNVLVVLCLCGDGCIG